MGTKTKPVDMELKHYFRLLRFALGLEPLTGDTKEWLKSADWPEVLRFAQKQALVGVMFEGISRLPKEYAPKGRDLFNWIAQAQMIEAQNRRLNAATVSVYRRIRELGAECCILKGQGNALLYQNPLSRMPGDVDVWVTCKRRNDSGVKLQAGAESTARDAAKPEELTRKELRELAFRLAEGHGKVGHESLNHIEMVVDGIAVELHPTPTVLNSPLHDARLQRWIRRCATSQSRNMVSLPDEEGQVAVPTLEFNVVYQLSHLYHHHLFEGIGLRQFIDYMLLIRGEGGRTLYAPLLKSLGFYNFAGAVMYVLREVFALRDLDMIVPADERRGKLLLADILHGGNFGQYDQSFTHDTWGHNMHRLRRDLRLMRYYPAETLSEPFFRLWHFIWRKKEKCD